MTQAIRSTKVKAWKKGGRWGSNVFSSKERPNQKSPKQGHTKEVKSSTI